MIRSPRLTVISRAELASIFFSLLSFWGNAGFHATWDAKDYRSAVSSCFVLAAISKRNLREKGLGSAQT